MATFTPAYAPELGSSDNSKYRILEAKFGDGYTQAAGDGINTKEQTIQLVWSDLSVTDVDAIIAFFDTQGGYTAFDYTLPNDSSALKFKCKQYKKSWAKGNLQNINATLERVYDL